MLKTVKNAIIGYQVEYRMVSTSNVFSAVDNTNESLRSKYVFFFYFFGKQCQLDNFTFQAMLCFKY